MAVSATRGLRHRLSGDPGRDDGQGGDGDGDGEQDHLVRAEAEGQGLDDVALLRGHPGAEQHRRRLLMIALGGCARALPAHP